MLTAVVVSGLVSIATGSSWSTIATIGVALLGIGKALGFHEGLIAGVVEAIQESFFISPLLLLVPVILLIVIISELFTTSGMAGMLNTVWLILSAMVFGGSMQAAGMLARITQSVIRMVKSTGSLIASTIGTSVFFNITTSDQYIAIVVPGEMYAKSYEERGLKPEVLSRTLKDGGTITSVLIPWNTCGATQSKVLGVSTWTYLPYCFFNIVNPIIAIGMGYLDYKIRRKEKQYNKYY